MTNKRPIIIAIVFILVIAAFVFVWQILIVPGFSEKESLIRNGNAALVKDISEIEGMNGSTKELEERITAVEEKIALKYAGRTGTDMTASDIILGILGDNGIFQAQISVGEGKLVSPAGTYIPALYTSEVTLLFEGDESVGSAVIRGIEKYPSADFEIMAFVYRAVLPEITEDTDDMDDKEEAEATAGEKESEKSGEWLITALIYYYE